MSTIFSTEVVYSRVSSWWCNSASSGPCVPQHVQSFTHCEDSLGSVSWAKSDGAESYMAIAVGLDGHTHMCTTNTTTCTFDDLHCGEQYTIHIIADDYMCSSMPSNSTAIRMGKQAVIMYITRNTLPERVMSKPGSCRRVFHRSLMNLNKRKKFCKDVGN